MESPMVVPSYHEQYGSEPAAAAVNTAVDEDDDTPEPPTKQQKLIKAGLLLALVVIVIYVILDYTVRRQACVSGATHAGMFCCCMHMVCYIAFLQFYIQQLAAVSVDTPKGLVAEDAHCNHD